MSLINDALKRASVAQEHQPAQAAVQAAMEPLQATARKSILPIVICLVAIGAIAVASVVFVRVWNQKNQLAAATEATTTVLPVPAKEIPSAKAQEVAPAQAVQVQSLPVAAASPEAVAPTSAAPVPATNSTALPSSSAIVTPTPPVPVFPELTVQAIVYTPQNPLVMIKGRTLREGDEVDGARIKKIDSKKVTMEWRGESRDFVVGSK